MNEGVTAGSAVRGVVLNLRLSDQRCGTSAERFRLAVLEGEIQSLLARQPGMEFEGRDIGEGYCTLYCHSEDPDALLTLLQPVVSAYRPVAGSYIELTCGDPISTSYHQRIDLAVGEDSSPIG